ncbi:MAG: hypothetical protein AAGC77_04010 [Pseudomonadota bacterium]
MSVVRHLLSIFIILQAVSGGAYAHNIGAEHSAFSMEHFGLIAALVLIAGIAASIITLKPTFRSSRREKRIADEY